MALLNKVGQRQGKKKRGKKSPLELEEQLPVDVDIPEFIPYACHYDPHTLLTKNGELMQTIKIVGFTAESVDRTQITLRDAVRKSLFEAFGTNEFAVWFHTIRRRKNLDPGGDFPGGFSHYLNRRWSDYHDWSHKFINELYITVVREGQDMRIQDPASFLRAIVPSREIKHRRDYLEKAHADLEQAVHNMLRTLDLYGARRLGMVEKRGVTYSEPLRFLSKIINLIEQPMPLPVKDLSGYLPKRKISFGFNALQLSGDGDEHFGAILTIKDYRELSTGALDKFLQLPQEFIISQCVDFIHADKVKAEYDYQQDLIRLSEDHDLARLTGLQEILNSDRGLAIDYGEQQLSVLMLEDDIEKLDASVDRAVKALGELGIVSMREDLRLEECYWSLLPGNFAFVSRLKPINTARVGGFASLHNFPAGRAIGNYWGPAATILYTAAGTPYFFSFHSHKEPESRGHTAIIGPYGAGKTVMLNFLCSEARKFNGRLVFFDKDQGSEVFIRALGGEYLTLAEQMKNHKISLNPLARNARLDDPFVHAWLHSLYQVQGKNPTAAEAEILKQALQALEKEPASKRTLSRLAEWLETHHHADLAAGLQPWRQMGRYGWVFDHERDNFSLDELVTGLDMTDLLEDSAVLQPVMLYMWHRLKQQLDGSPTMIVLDEAWHLLDHPVLAPRVAEWLQHLEQQNALAILATESVDKAAESRISSQLMRQIATQIYLPNPQAKTAYREIFGLSEREYSLIPRMREDLRHFLLKHDDDSIIAQLDLGDMEDVLCVLSANAEQRELFASLTRRNGLHPDQWLLEYQRICVERAQEAARKERHAMV